MVQLADRIDVSHYSYRVAWSSEDSEYLATVTEFPSLSWLAGTQREALEGLIRLIEDVVVDLQENGETVPAPLSEREYSGHFRVRIPPSLHRELVHEAAEMGISLNRLVSDRLAHRS